MRLICIVSLATCALATAPADADYLCKVNGKYAYSSLPCIAEDAAIVPVPLPTQAVANPDRDAYQLQHEAGLGHVVVGQLATQVEEAWGRPKRVNRTTSSTGTVDQWVYERDGATQYVYLKAGRVTSVSTEESIGLEIAPTGSTPTRAELQEQIRADKAGERRFVTRQWSKGTVLARLGPPNEDTFIVGGERLVYEPTPKDQQTLTTIIIDGATDRVADVRRVVKY